MVSVNQIKWGSYKSYEGPYYPGGDRFVLGASPTDNEKFLAVITATEGSSFDAVNMYDSCILSSGLIQWCELYYGVSNMIGSLAETDGDLLTPLNSALSISNASFKRRPDGRWRFFFNDSRGEVNSTAKMQALFLKNSTGIKGSWDDGSKEYAKTWAACIASLWGNDETHAVQIKYTTDRLGMFLTRDSKAILFGPQSPIHNKGFVGAVRAIYYSFAANSPTVASEQLRIIASQSYKTQWSEAWVIEIIKQLTFGPKIQIYPGRYNKIRPIVELLYEVNLPDFYGDLEKWKADDILPDFSNVIEIQNELIAEGYDLGPRGADGVYGTKTRQAVKDFQMDHNIGADGIVGPNTRRMLSDMYLGRTNK